jgi:hypothetical protein
LAELPPQTPRHLRPGKKFVVLNERDILSRPPAYWEALEVSTFVTAKPLVKAGWSFSSMPSLLFFTTAFPLNDNW